MDKQESPLKQIRTFQGDVAEALAKQRESLVSIQRREQQKTGGKIPLTDVDLKKRKQFFYLLIGSLFFLVLGAFGARYAYNEFLRKNAAPTMVAPANRFISTNTGLSPDCITGEIFVTHVTGDTITSSLSFHPYFSFKALIKIRFAELPEFTNTEYLHPCHLEYSSSNFLT